MRLFLLAAFAALAGCASYVTPGGPARLDDIDRSDIAEVAARKPTARFPAHIAVVRVQAANYRSQSTEPLARGHFSVLTTQELMSEEDLQAMGAWPGVAGIAPINRLLLPERLETVDDLRVSAARLQADMLMVYTVDTSFRIQNRGFGPLVPISLGLIPDRDAYVISTASAMLVDVHTGYVYGVAEGMGKASGLASIWTSSDTVDRKRVETEKLAFDMLVVEAGKTWRGVASEYAQK